MGIEGRDQEAELVASLIPASLCFSLSPMGVSFPSLLEAGSGVSCMRCCGAFKLTGPYVSPSQSDIGFGKLETYVKLDKLGEVRGWAGQ